jgi:hypothetical protein
VRAALQALRGEWVPREPALDGGFAAALGFLRAQQERGVRTDGRWLARLPDDSWAVMVPDAQLRAPLRGRFAALQIGVADVRAPRRRAQAHAPAQVALQVESVAQGLRQ